MRAFSASVSQVDHTTWRVEPTKYRATDFAIEPDASAATYLWAAEAITGGKIDLGVPMDAFTQPDAKAAEFIRMFPKMPAVIVQHRTRIVQGSSICPLQIVTTEPGEID